MLANDLPRPTSPAQADHPSILDLPIGQKALIEEVLGASEQFDQLARVGIVAGSEITLIDSGDPAIVGLGNVRLCVRKDLLSLVVVTYPSPNAARSSNL